MPSARLTSRAEKRDCDRPERAAPSELNDAKTMNAENECSSESANTEFCEPDHETLAPLARMILVLEGMRSCANDKVLSAATDRTAEMTGNCEDSGAQTGAKTGWAPGVLAEIQTMFERDWTPEPIRHQSAKLFGQKIVPVNDTRSSTDHSETLRN